MMAARSIGELRNRPVLVRQVRQSVCRWSEETAARTGDKWHLDKVFLNINGVTHYLWRAVDQNGIVLNILMQPKQDRFAALRFFRKLLRVTPRSPRAITTDKLHGCGAAKRMVMPRVAHRQHPRAGEANATF
jgi:transposase-like protein